jgi:AcrR family transcriptional regulator
MHKKLSPDERKAQIIQTALQLFAVKGYDNTTVNNIINEAGISKGGFYHHYNSKEELLEDIVRMLIGDMAVIFEEIDARGDLTALEKTNEYIRRVTAYKGDKTVEVAAFLSELYSGGKNVLLESKIYDFARKHVAPVMKQIILQGVEEGTFKTEFPEEAAETYIKLFIMQQQEMTDLFYEALRERNEEILETIKRKYSFFQKLLEDILGLEKGSLVVEEVMGGTTEMMGKQMIGGPGLG